MTTGRIAELTGLTTGSATRLVDRLERAGYVVRERDAGDRRRVLVAPVPEKVAEFGRVWDRSRRRLGRTLRRPRRPELALFIDHMRRTHGLRCASRPRGCGRERSERSGGRGAVPRGTSGIGRGGCRSRGIVELSTTWRVSGHAVRDLQRRRRHPDPTTGRTPTERERIKAMVAIALKAEEVGLDVFATGEHHNPPFVPSSPTTMLGYIAARTERLILSTVDHPDHHQRPGEDRRGLRDAAAPGRRPGRPDDGPRQHRPGLPVVRPGHPQRHPARDRELRPAAPAVARGRRRLGGQVPHAAAGLHLHARARWTAYRRSSGTARSAARRSPSRPRTTATASSHNNIFWPTDHYQADDRALPRAVRALRARHAPTRRSSGSAARCSCGKNSQDAMREFRPYFDNAPVYGHGPVAGGLHRRRPR